VDGGLVNNFPAEQCRAMGADYVIGVSMSPGLENETEKLSSIFSQMKQLKEIITDKEFENYHTLCDIFISPDLKGVGMLSFDAESVATITQSGYEAAAEQEANFKALKELIFAGEGELADNSKNKAKALNILKAPVLISRIEMEGVAHDIEKWMRRKCTVKVGERISKSDIDKSVSIYYGTGNYNSITYTLHKDPSSEEGYILRFKFVDNPPHDFGVGFHFDSQDMISVLLRLGINSNRINGVKADISTKLGGNQWLKANLSYGRMLYPKINLEYIFRNSELDAYDMDALVMNMKFLQHKFRVYLSENYSRTLSLGAGIEAELLDPRKVMYSSYDTTNKDTKEVNTLGSFAYLRYDNLNKRSFPTRGIKGSADFMWRDITFSSRAKQPLGVGSLTFGIEGYVPLIEERLVAIPQLYGGFIFGKGATSGSANGWNPLFKGPVPCYPSMNNMVGGAEMGRYIDQHLPFIGLNRLSLAFNNLAIARADFRVRVHKNHYLTAMVNYGRSAINMKNFFKERKELLWSEMYDYNASNWWGAGLRYSIDTKVGPLNFDISSSNISRKVNLYFSFGYYF
jgi:NTE family protein